VKGRPLLGFATIAALGACTVGPDYARPELDVPLEHRRAATELGAPPAGDAPQLGELLWEEVFTDPVLQELIRTALEQNGDLRIAAARILEARANLGIVRSRYYPDVNAGAGWTATRTAENGASTVPPGTDATRDYYDVFLAVPTWELDFWGKIRRAEEGALAGLLATEESRNAIRQTLIADVASAYYQLLGLDQELLIAERTLESRLESLELTQNRESGGVGSLADVRQSEVLVSEARAAIPATQLAIEQVENLLNLLLGQNPGPIPRGAPLLEETMLGEVAAGVPSDLLERRPDLRAAEQVLVAANADIGVAKAAYYPSISLTGAYGFQSTELGDLFESGAQNWFFAPTIDLPIFNGGRLDAQTEAAKARFEQALEGYRQAVRAAFGDVSNALIAYRRTRELSLELATGTEAQRDAVRLARVRYDGGVTTYLEVLFNDQQLFASELRLTRTQVEEFLTYVRLYRALGGGWQVPQPEPGEPGAEGEEPDAQLARGAVREQG
jgi:multidrug efflux system outer membrane protein